MDHRQRQQQNQKFNVNNNREVGKRRRRRRRKRSTVNKRAKIWNQVQGLEPHTHIVPYTVYEYPAETADLLNYSKN
jgi:hypothetical protein